MPETQQNKETPQSILNKSFNKTYEILSVEQMEYDPSGVMRSKITSVLTSRLDEGATYTYVGKATPGASDSDAVWQIIRYPSADFSEGLYADGDASFDNVWEDRESLIYN